MPSLTSIQPALTQLFSNLCTKVSRHEPFGLPSVQGDISVFDGSLKQHWAVYCWLSSTSHFNMALTLFTEAFDIYVVACDSWINFCSLEHKCTCAFDLFPNQMVNYMTPSARLQNHVFPFAR
ncbi:hypothetical protein ILYODFUR_034364 [Ilyodon furcidens]|uniref:Uncharacterized protein n=1 Tax=Ilyodon furcidens TaxID=33524 RepID=A0ABV0SRI4_9TELE